MKQAFTWSVPLLARVLRLLRSATKVQSDQVGLGLIFSGRGRLDLKLNLSQPAAVACSLTFCSVVTTPICFQSGFALDLSWESWTIEQPHLKKMFMFFNLWWVEKACSHLSPFYGFYGSRDKICNCEPWERWLPMDFENLWSMNTNTTRYGHNDTSNP